jgi:hypothetical protein
MRVLGTTEEVTTCDCCGRQGLKKTVALETDGGISYYGETCAAQATGRPARDIRSDAKHEDDKTARELSAQAAALAAQRNAKWFAFLNAKCPGMDRAEQIRALGGYSAARIGFASSK